MLNFLFIYLRCLSKFSVFLEFKVFVGLLVNIIEGKLINVFVVEVCWCCLFDNFDGYLLLILLMFKVFIICW